MKSWIENIEGYEFLGIEFDSGYFSFRAPMGATESDKRMFDKLVYFNQRICHGHNKDKVIERIRDFIQKHRIS